MLLQNIQLSKNIIYQCISPLLKVHLLYSYSVLCSIYCLFTVQLVTCQLLFVLFHSYLVVDPEFETTLTTFLGDEMYLNYFEYGGEVTKYQACFAYFIAGKTSNKVTHMYFHDMQGSF